MFRARLGVLVVVLLALGVAGAQGQTVLTVTCPPETGGMFTKINQALGALDPVGQTIIEVSGTCQERLALGDGTTGMENVSLTAAPGKTAIIEPPPAGQGRGTVVMVCGAHDVDISNLVIRNGAIGLQVCDATELDTVNLTLENNSVVGADVYGNSMVFFSDQTVIQNNGQIGVNVRGGSRVFFLHFNAGPGAVVQGHTLWGVAASGGSALEFVGGHQVTGNGTAGNAASGGINTQGSSLQMASNGRGNPAVSGNAGAGVLAKTGSSLSMRGTTVSGNGGGGVLLRLLSVAELTGANTFVGNTGAAVSCDESSWAGGDLTGASPLDCTKLKK